MSKTRIAGHQQAQKERYQLETQLTDSEKSEFLDQLLCCLDNYYLHSIEAFQAIYKLDAEQRQESLINALENIRSEFTAKKNPML